MMHVSIKKTSILSALALCACVLALPYIASAEEFVSLAGIPGLESASGDKISMEGYLDNLYRMAIIAAALIAVIKLILAGAQYVLSGVVTDKEKAKTDIRSALIGLLIILAATTLLTTINPSLTNLKALEPVGYIPPGKMPPKSPEQIKAEAFCDSPSGCEKQRCGNFSFSLIFDAKGAATAAGNSILCHTKCSWYSGIIVNDTCIYPKDLDISTDYLVEKIMNEAEQCSENECEEQNCLWAASNKSCSDWCVLNDGIFIDRGFLSTAKCVLPKSDEARKLPL